MPRAVEAQSSNHWTAREFPVLSFSLGKSQLKVWQFSYLSQESALNFTDLLYCLFCLYFIYFCSDLCYFLPSSNSGFHFSVLFLVPWGIKLCFSDFFLFLEGGRLLLWASPLMSVSDGAVVENLPASAGHTGDTGSIPGLGTSPSEGNSNPLQYSCLGNPMDRGAWQATVHGVAKSQTRLSNWTTT